MPRLEIKTAASEASPLVDATFLDGAVVVQMLNPGIAKTLLDYVEHVFCHRYQQSSRTPLVLILFGIYIKHRSKCVRRQVVTSVLIPKILKDFVPVDENKAEYCLASCHTRSPFYRERCMKLMATMCFAL